MRLCILDFKVGFRVGRLFKRRTALKTIATLVSGAAASGFATAATTIRVAAASDLKFALATLIKSFTQITGILLDVQFS
jgi:ABC-type molybdate transport system substrate-binding protein